MQCWAGITARRADGVAGVRGWNKQMLLCNKADRVSRQCGMTQPKIFIQLNQSKIYAVIKTSAIGIKRHKKIKADANPYMKEYSGYFWERRHKKESTYLPGFTSRQMRLALNL